MARTVWFPGHMAKGKRQLEALAKNIDLILEVRDARSALDKIVQIFILGAKILRSGDEERLGALASLTSRMRSIFFASASSCRLPFAICPGNHTVRAIYSISPIRLSGQYLKTAGPLKKFLGTNPQNLPSCELGLLSPRQK